MGPDDSLRHLAEVLLQHGVASVPVLYHTPPAGMPPQLLQVVSLSEILKCEFFSVENFEVPLLFPVFPIFPVLFPSHFTPFPPLFLYLLSLSSSFFVKFPPVSPYFLYLNHAPIVHYVKIYYINTSILQALFGTSATCQALSLSSLSPLADCHLARGPLITPQEDSRPIGSWQVSLPELPSPLPLVCCLQVEKFIFFPLSSFVSSLLFWNF